MQYNNTFENPVPLILLNVYMAIPFLIELRCLLDFTFSKTSLDIFQFWQLFQYHTDFYMAKNNNVYYDEKEQGYENVFVDKLPAYLIGIGLLALVVGPLVFFSTVGGFVAPNPVTSGQLTLSFMIKKSLTNADLDKFVGAHHATIANMAGDLTHPASSTQMSETGHADSLNVQSMKNNQTNLKTESVKITDVRDRLNQTIPYILYDNKYPLQRTYNKSIFQESPYSKWTETRFFKPA